MDALLAFSDESEAMSLDICYAKADRFMWMRDANKNGPVYVDVTPVLVDLGLWAVGPWVMKRQMGRKQTSGIIPIVPPLSLSLSLLHYGLLSESSVLSFNAVICDKGRRK